MWGLPNQMPRIIINAVTYQILQRSAAAAAAAAAAVAVSNYARNRQSSKCLFEVLMGMLWLAQVNIARIYNFSLAQKGLSKLS